MKVDLNLRESWWIVPFQFQLRWIPRHTYVCLVKSLSILFLTPNIFFSFLQGFSVLSFFFSYFFPFLINTFCFLVQILGFGKMSWTGKERNRITLKKECYTVSWITLFHGFWSFCFDLNRYLSATDNLLTQQMV